MNNKIATSCMILFSFLSLLNINAWATNNKNAVSFSIAYSCYPIVEKLVNNLRTQGKDIHLNIFSNSSKTAFALVNITYDEAGLWMSTLDEVKVVLKECQSMRRVEIIRDGSEWKSLEIEINKIEKNNGKVDHIIIEDKFIFIYMK